MSNKNTVVSVEDRFAPDRVYRFVPALSEACQDITSELWWDTTAGDHEFTELTEGIPPTIRAYPNIFKRKLSSETPTPDGPDEVGEPNTALCCEVEICRQELPSKLRDDPLLEQTLDSFSRSFSYKNELHESLDTALDTYLSQWLKPSYWLPLVEQNRLQSWESVSTMALGIALIAGGVGSVVLCTLLGGFPCPWITVAILCGILPPVGAGLYLVSSVVIKKITELHNKSAAKKELRRLVEEARLPKHAIPVGCPKESPEKQEPALGKLSSTLDQPDAITRTAGTQTTAMQQKGVVSKPPNSISQNAGEDEQDADKDSKGVENAQYSSDPGPHGAMHENLPITQLRIAEASIVYQANATTLTVPERTTTDQQAEPCYKLPTPATPILSNNPCAIFGCQDKPTDELTLELPTDVQLASAEDYCRGNYYRLYFSS